MATYSKLFIKRGYFSQLNVYPETDVSKETLVNGELAVAYTSTTCTTDDTDDCSLVYGMNGKNHFLPSMKSLTLSNSRIIALESGKRDKSVRIAGQKVVATPTEFVGDIAKGTVTGNQVDDALVSGSPMGNIALGTITGGVVTGKATGNIAFETIDTFNIKKSTLRGVAVPNSSYPELSLGNIARGTIAGGSEIATIEGSNVVIPSGNIALNTITGGKVPVGSMASGNLASKTVIGGASPVDIATLTGNIAGGTITGGSNSGGSPLGNIAIGTLNGGTSFSNPATIDDVVALGNIAKNTITGGSTYPTSGNGFATGNIKLNTITGGKVPVGNMVSGNIAKDTILGNKVPGTYGSGIVSLGNIALDTITGEKTPTADYIAKGNIAIGTVTGGVTSGKATGNIDYRTIVNDNIVLNTITTSAIALSTITGGSAPTGVMSSGNIAKGTITGGVDKTVTPNLATGNLKLNTVAFENLDTSLQTLINSKIDNISSLEGSIINISTVLGGASQPLKTDGSMDKMTSGQIGKLTVTGSKSPMVTTQGAPYFGNIAYRTIGEENIALGVLTGGVMPFASTPLGNIAIGTLSGGSNAGTNAGIISSGSILAGDPSGNIAKSTIVGGSMPSQVRNSSDVMTYGNVAKSTITGGAVPPESNSVPGVPLFMSVGNIARGTIIGGVSVSTGKAIGNIAPDTITGGANALEGNIAGGTIKAYNIATGTIEGSNIKSATITPDKLAVNTYIQSGSALFTGNLGSVTAEKAKKYSWIWYPSGILELSGYTFNSDMLFPIAFDDTPLSVTVSYTNLYASTDFGEGNIVLSEVTKDGCHITRGRCFYKAIGFKATPPSL